MGDGGGGVMLGAVNLDSAKQKGGCGRESGPVARVSVAW